MSSIRPRGTKQKHANGASRSKYLLFSATHAIDLDKASIVLQNCYVPDCTKKVCQQMWRKDVSLQMFYILDKGVLLYCCKNVLKIQHN